MLNVMVTGLLCISMLLVASSCNLCLFTVKFYWNIKKKKNASMNVGYVIVTLFLHMIGPNSYYFLCKLYNNLPYFRM